MFKQSAAKLSLLLLAFLLFPSARSYADTGDSTDIVIGTDPQPSGDPKPNAMVDSQLWLEMEAGIIMAMHVS